MAKNADVTDINVYRNQRRHNKNVRWVLIPVFLVVCMVAGFFFSMSPLFSVRSVEVEGNTFVTDEEVLSLAGVEKGMNLFAANRARIEELLPILPRVKSAHVKRTLLGSVVITVEEREPVAMLLVGRAALELDREGRIIDRYTTITHQAYPLITGVDTTDQGLIAGSYITGAPMATALGVLTGLKEGAADVGEINVSDPENIKIYTLSGLEVRIGDDSDLEEKYNLYNSIIQENLTGSREIRYIDVSILDKPAMAFE